MAEKRAVISGAILKCKNAAYPLDFISTNDADGFIYEGGESIGCINDNVHGKNIIEFPCSICAIGIPCVPEFKQPWVKGVPSARDADVILLTEDSTIFCAKGAWVNVDDPGQDEITFTVNDAGNDTINILSGGAGGIPETDGSTPGKAAAKIAKKTLGPVGTVSDIVGVANSRIVEGEFGPKTQEAIGSAAGSAGGGWGGAVLGTMICGPVCGFIGGGVGAHAGSNIGGGITKKRGGANGSITDEFKRGWEESDNPESWGAE